MKSQNVWKGLMNVMHTAHTCYFLWIGLDYLLLCQWFKICFFSLHYLVSVNFTQPGWQSMELITGFVNESFHQTEGMNIIT